MIGENFDHFLFAIFKQFFYVCEIILLSLIYGKRLAIILTLNSFILVIPRRIVNFAINFNDLIYFYCVKKY